MAKTSADGVDLWYDLQGRGEPLVLIGGFALVHDQFASQFRTVHWNYRGVGRSDWTMTEPYTIERWVEDLRAVLDAAGIKKASIWATSTGAAIGIRFASKYPERTGALVTYPWVRSDETWRDIFETSYRIGRTFGVAAISRVFSSVIVPPHMLYTPAANKIEKWLTAAYERNLNPATLKGVADAYANVDLTADIKRLRCPTLLLMGDESALDDKAALKSASFDVLVQDFTALKADAELAAVSGAGNTYCITSVRHVS